MPEKFMLDKTLDIIETIRIRHHDLCTICRNINEIFSLRILLIVVQSFIGMTALLYYAGDHILLEDNISVKYLTYCGTQLTLSTLQLLVLVISCSITSTEVKHILSNVDKLLRILMYFNKRSTSNNIFLRSSLRKQNQKTYCALPAKKQN